MLLAYIDEVGEPGAFVSTDHLKFNTSPAFGYAGFVISEEKVRDFSAAVEANKRRLFQTEYIEQGQPARWEVKGASMFRKTTSIERPQNFRVFGALVSQLCAWNGALFYYADEKPLGTPKQTSLDVKERERRAMFETLNRLCRYADNQQKNLLVMIDQINEKTRVERLPEMYGHIFSRTTEYPEMKRIVEPPMHIDSKLSTNVQFADWVAAAVNRGIDYQVIKSSAYKETATAFFPHVKRAFTYESKLHWNQKTLNDLCHEKIFDRFRPLHVPPRGHRIADDPEIAAKLNKVHEAAKTKHRKPHQ